MCFPLPPPLPGVATLSYLLTPLADPSLLGAGPGQVICAPPADAAGAEVQPARHAELGQGRCQGWHLGAGPGGGGLEGC
eukprot:256342-Chlamydomonas_euryale.AAC.4